MSFWGGLARGTGNFAKNTGKAALDLNKAGGSFARWALRLPGHTPNAYRKAISNGITNGLQGNPITAGIGRHFQGHDLFAHDQGDGYGIFDPGKGMKESGNGSGSGRGFGNGRGLGNGSGGYGNIYHFHSNNYGTVNNNHGTVNNNSGTVNNSVSTNTINGNNYGIQGGSGNTQNFGMSPLVNHLNNAYVDTHIQDYQPPKIKTPPISNVLSGVKQKALPFTNNSATSTLPGPPGGQVALKAAAPGSYDDDGNFVPAPREKMPRKLLPSQLNSPAIYDAPGIKSVIPEKPNFKGPQNNQFKFNHETNPSGESAMNPTQASLLTRKASSMLPYINDVYAFEPEDVRMALALDAAIQFYKNAAKDGTAVDVKAPMPTMPKEEKTVDPSIMLSKVHPDIIAKHTEKALAANPGFTGFDDAVHGRYSTSDGTEFGKGKRFTVPNSTSVRLGKGAHNALFHGWAEDDFHPTNAKIGGGATAESLASEIAKEKRLRRTEKARTKAVENPGAVNNAVPLGDTLSEGIKKTRQKEQDNSYMEPIPGQTGTDSDVPVNKNKMINQIRKEISSPNEFKVNPNATEDSTDEEVNVPRTEEERRSLVKSLHDSTPNLTMEEKKKLLPQSEHGYLDDAAAEDNHTNYPARHVSPAEKAKGQELARRQQEWEERRQQGLQPKDYKGVDLPDVANDEEDNDGYVKNRTRRDMEKGKFSPGNRESAPIESYNPDDENDEDDENFDNNPDLLNDGDYGDARQMARDQWLGDFGNKPLSGDEAFKEKLREKNKRIPEAKRKGKVDLDRGGKGIAPVKTKRKEEVKKDHAEGIASEIARRDNARDREHRPDDKSQFRRLHTNKGKNASKLDELRTITAGMDSYEIEAIADGLLNLGYGIDHIVQVASEGEDVNGSTSAVADVANVKDSHEIPDWVKRGLH